jgi:hypothetical protein
MTIVASAQQRPLNPQPGTVRGQQNAAAANARSRFDAVLGGISSPTTSGLVLRGDTGDPLQGVLVRPKPLELPNAFDKPCKRSAETDLSEGPSAVTNLYGAYTLELPEESDAPQMPATREQTAEDETARRILEMERLRRQADAGVTAVDQRRVDQTRLPQETIDFLKVQGTEPTVPLWAKQGAFGRVAGVREGFVAAPYPGPGRNDLVMLPAPTLSGRVVDANDRPVAGAIVEVFEVRTRPLGRTMKWVKSTLTNDLGEYRLFWLPYGWYIVAAGYSNYVQQSWRDTLKLSPNLPEPDFGEPLTFFPGVENAPDAQMIHIKPPASETDGRPAPTAPIALKERPRFNLKVRLVAETIASNANLIVVPAGGDVCAGMDFAIKSNGDGTFDVRDIPRGRYGILAIRGKDVISDLLPINVEKNEDLKLAVTEPIVVRGSLTFEDPPPGADINRLLGEIRVNLTRARSESSQVATTIADPRTFNFSMTGLGPGFYFPTIDLPPGAFIKDIHAAGLQWTTGGSVEDWTCGALPYGNYAYLDSHEHLSPLNLPSDLDTGIKGSLLCLKITISFSGRLAGPSACIIPQTMCTPAIAVLLPRSAWGRYDDNGVTPPDRIQSVPLRGGWEFSGLPSGDYRIYGVPFASADLIYRREFDEWFNAWSLHVLYEYVPPCTGDRPGRVGDPCVLPVPNQDLVNRVAP